MRWLSLLLCLTLLGGCSGMELIERGFILGVAIDRGENDKVVLTSQFYRPSTGNSNSSGSYVNIRTEGNTIFDAVRNITMHLGRKAQWSHMQTILIGESMLRSTRWKDALDFFYRDDEPRLTTLVVATKGEAGPYLTAKPYMETTISRQTHEIQRSAYRYSAKTVELSLLDLRLQLDKPVPLALLPYLTFEESPEKDPYFNGAAVISQSGMRDVLTAKQVQSYHILKNQFQAGIIVLPCGSENKGDSLEVVSLDTKLTTKMEDGIPQLHTAINMNIMIRELVCTSLATTADGYEYQRTVANNLENQLNSLVSSLKKNKLDLLGAGNAVYRHHPRQWRKLEQDWGDRFSKATIGFEIRITLLNTGVEDGKPALSKGDATDGRENSDLAAAIYLCRSGHLCQRT